MRIPFSSLTLKQVMPMIPATQVYDWEMEAKPHPPSAHLLEDLRRLQVFKISTSEAGKLTLVDALLKEILFSYPQIAAWKEVTLSTDQLKGVADFVIAPNLAYLTTPLLCVIEAKKDDFEKGEAQCIGGMLACLLENQKEGKPTHVFGIVSNGEGWQFYQLTTDHQVFRSKQFGIGLLPELLGILNGFFAKVQAILSS